MIKLNSFQVYPGNKQHSNLYQTALYALSPVPTARRLGSLPGSVEENNHARAVLLTGLAATSIPGDVRELAAARKEVFGNVPIRQLIAHPVKNIPTVIPNAVKSLTNPDNACQRPLSFFKGTFLSTLSDKSKLLNKMDKTLFDTRFGELTRRKLKINTKETAEKIINGRKITHYKFSGNIVKELTGKALLRTPVLGVAAGFLLELPAVIKSTQEGKNAGEKSKSIFKQLCKSAAYIGLITTGIAFSGAAFASFGTAASLGGMALGSTLALMASNKINKAIDKTMA